VAKQPQCDNTNNNMTSAFLVLLQAAIIIKTIAWMMGLLSNVYIATAGMRIGTGKQEYREKTCPGAILSTADPMLS
jgi:hypothetical protein